MLTTKEISQNLKVSEESVRRWIRNGELKATQEGKSYLVDETDLERFVQEKAKVGSTSIGKMAAFLPLIGVVGGPAAGLIAGATAAITNKINSKANNTEISKSQANVDEQSVLEIENYIEDLERKKKKLDLEYQMKLLQIDEEISHYQKIIRKLEMGD